MIEKLNLKNQADSVAALFEYKKIGTLNGQMLNVLQAENRTLDFHAHEFSDEMFYCIEGEFDIEFEDGATHLREGDLVIVPKGTRHRPVCKKTGQMPFDRNRRNAQQRKHRRHLHGMKKDFARKPARSSERLKHFVQTYETVCSKRMDA